jgi:hypothetical protein
MSFNFTADDLLILETLRLERLRAFFAQILTDCVLYLDRQNCLTIHCPEPWMVDELVDQVEQLRWYSYIVVGAQRLSIYFSQEEVYSAITVKPVKKSQRDRRFPQAAN